MIRRLLAFLALICAGQVCARAVPFPAHFDSIGTPLQSMKTREGRIVHFTDTGEAGWTPMLFIGGVGTSARAPELVAFLDSLRRHLKVRIIAVERNGLGDTAFDPNWTIDDYKSEVRQVLDRLGIQRFALVAISGGGAYAGHIAAAMPDRVTSWHMLAAIASAPTTSPICAADEATLRSQLAPLVAAPRRFWDMPPNGVAGIVPGFVDRAADEGARAFFIAGQQGDVRGIAREYHRFCDAPAPVTAFPAPAFFYYGEADPLVPPSDGAYWASRVAANVTFHRYPGEGHDVQYRHWDQVLLDVAGYGDRTLVCKRGHARMMKLQEVATALTSGATLGICAWTSKLRSGQDVGK